MSFHTFGRAEISTVAHVARAASLSTGLDLFGKIGWNEQGQVVDLSI